MKALGELSGISTVNLTPLFTKDLMALETVALLTPSSYRVWLRKGKENVRIAKIFDSPYHPEREVTFRITEEGVVD